MFLKIIGFSADMLSFIPRQIPYIHGKEILHSFLLLFTRRFRSEKTVSSFEKKFAAYLGSEGSCVFPSSRIALLHILKYYGIERGDEILLPAHSYSGLLNILEKAGANPIFVDIDATLNIDPRKIRKKVTKKTRALLLPHHYGNPCDYDLIRDAVGDDVIIIEDCAQAFGAEYKGKKAGTLGDVGIFSFGRGKHFDLMGGSAVVSKDARLISSLRESRSSFSLSRIHFLKSIILHFYVWLSSATGFSRITTYPFLLFLSAFSKEDYLAKVVGHLYKEKIALDNKNFRRFNGIQAWLGIRRLNRIDEVIAKQRENAHYLLESISSMEGIALPRSCSGKSTHLYLPLMVEGRDGLARSLLRDGVDTKRDFHHFFGFKENKNNRTAKRLSERIIHLPVHAGLTRKQLDHILKALKKSVSVQ